MTNKMAAGKVRKSDAVVSSERALSVPEGLDLIRIFLELGGEDRAAVLRFAQGILGRSQAN